MIIDLGKKDSLEATIPSKEKNKIRYPSLYIDNKDIGLDDKDVGRTIDCKIEVKVKRVSKNMDEQKKTYSCELDVLSIDIPSTDIEKMKDEDLDEMEEIEFNRLKKLGG